MKDKWSIITLTIVFSMVLIACSSPAAQPSLEEQEISIALVIGGPRDDHSWAQASYDALQEMARRGMKTALSESVPETDAARVFRQYVDEGYDIIIAHSFSYWDATFEVAAEAPHVNFAWGGGIQDTGPNVGDYAQPFYEAAYMVGILAGFMSETGSLGALYGFDIPVCHSMGEAMLAGAKTINPDSRLTVTSVGDWVDVAAAREAGLAQVDIAGVDFFIGCGQGPTLGSLAAAREIGAYATGYVGDMSVLAPDTVLSSIVWNMVPIFEAMVEETVNGTFDNLWMDFGVAEGAMDIVINPNLMDQVPQEALAAIEQARQAIISGELVVPFIPE
jgi:basic membrane protein A and related proteins